MGKRPESVTGARIPRAGQYGGPGGEGNRQRLPVFYIIRTRLEYAFSEV